MAKINQAGFEKLKNNLPSNVKVFLSYGNDEGLVYESAEFIAKKINPDLNDPFNVEQLTTAQIKEDAGILYMAATSTSLMGGRKLIIVKGATDVITPAVKDYLTTDTDSFLVMFGEGLNTKSTLVALVEGSDFGIGLGCYADDIGALRQLISQMLSDNGIKFDNDTVQFLTSKLGADRKMTRSEMDKLITYIGDEKLLTIEMAQACIDDASAVSFENLTDAIYGKNPKNLSSALQKLYGEGESEIAILRIVTAFFKKLLPAYKSLEKNSSIEIAINNIKPKPFYKQADKIKAHLTKWDFVKVNRALEILLEAEANCKTTNYPVSLICERALLQIINLR